MAQTPSSGAISLGDLRSAFGDSGAVSLSDYYADTDHAAWAASAGSIPFTMPDDDDSAFPESGAFSLSDAYNKGVAVLREVVDSEELITNEDQAISDVRVGQRVEFNILCNLSGEIQLSVADSSSSWATFNVFYPWRAQNSGFDNIDGSEIGGVFLATSPRGIQLVKLEWRPGSSGSAQSVDYAPMVTR